MARRKLSKAVRLFFDFYVINELYLRCGGFRDIGYNMYSVFVPENIFDKIRFSYEDIVETLFEKVVKCLASTTRGELIKHFYVEASDDEHYMSAYRLRRNEGYSLKLFYGDGIIEHAAKASHLFRDYDWNDEYGGEAWAKAADALADLKNVKTLSDKVYWIDRVMDLHHNTGHILNKTEFSSLENDSDTNKHAYISFLDYRAEAKSILEFIDFCSSKIRKLIIPRKRILI